MFLRFVTPLRGIVCVPVERVNYSVEIIRGTVFVIAGVQRNRNGGESLEGQARFDEALRPASSMDAQLRISIRSAFAAGLAFTTVDTLALEAVGERTDMAGSSIAEPDRCHGLVGGRRASFDTLSNVQLTCQAEELDQGCAKQQRHAVRYFAGFVSQAMKWCAITRGRVHEGNL